MPLFDIPQERASLRRLTFMRLLLAHLTILDVQGPADDGVGICTNLTLRAPRMSPRAWSQAKMKGYLVNTDMWATMYSLLLDYCERWPKHSGLRVHPIPSLDPEVSAGVAYRASTKWAGGYGYLRRELLGFLIQELQGDLEKWPAPGDLGPNPPQWVLEDRLGLLLHLRNLYTQHWNRDRYLCSTLVRLQRDIRWPDVSERVRQNLLFVNERITQEMAGVQDGEGNPVGALGQVAAAWSGTYLMPWRVGCGENDQVRPALRTIFMDQLVLEEIFTREVSDAAE